MEGETMATKTSQMLRVTEKGCIFGMTIKAHFQGPCEACKLMSLAGELHTLAGVVGASAHARSTGASAATLADFIYTDVLSLVVALPRSAVPFFRLSGLVGEGMQHT